MYAIVDYHLVSLFSMRSLYANAFSACTLPCPTPAAIKLGLLAKLLEQEGSANAQAMLDWLAPLAIWWRPPTFLAVSTAAVRVWKSDGSDKPLVGTKGMREYAHAAECFGLAIGSVPTANRDQLSFSLGQLRTLGTAESLVQPLSPPIWADDPPAGFVELTREATAANGTAVVLDDLGDDPNWMRLNVYRAADRSLIPKIGPDRVRRIVALPLKVCRWNERGYIMEHVDPLDS